ncbi:MAG: class I mannose-6-phosphate isomerase [Chloroflexi bacterium]|nr:class I mannose-6-phosphate isomerase [Chloroflexota bacterium]
MNYYPLKLQSIAKEKVWGGRNLARVLGKPLPPQQLIGETWEAWEGCVIENGEARGKTLAQLIERDADGILGTRATRFPLLFKFIDAQDDLSVQVHSDDAAAQATENYPFGKTEAWYILDAEPNARLILGFKNQCTADAVRAALARQTLTDLLAEVRVQAGDVVFVPAGTVHAIGKGIVLAEIQENSDITYRLYDWGRVGTGRALHIEPSLRVARFQPILQPKIQALAIEQREFTRRFRVACRYFVLEEIDARERFESATLGKFHILAAIRGGLEIAYGARFESRVEIGQGETFVLPARLGVFALTPSRVPAKLLRMYPPELRADIIAPLTQAGVPPSEIARLGGSIPEANDLYALT